MVSDHSTSVDDGRIHIVRIIARLNVGGPARHVAWLTAGLQQAGCESLLVTGRIPPGEDDMGYFAVAHGVEPLVIPEMSREISVRDAVTIWKLYRLFRQVQPDIVHTHTAKAGTVGRVAGLLYRWLAPLAASGGGGDGRRPHRCQFVHTYHGHVFHSYYGTFKTNVFLIIEKFLARFATDRIIVISPQQRREINEEFGVGRADQFRVIPLGLDLKMFDKWAERRAGARDELKADETDVLVGIVGRLTEIKNHELFVQAAALYKKMQKSAANKRRVRFLVIGDGHLRPRLEEQARRSDLGEDISFLGSRKDPENFYPALDVVALTSLNEGTPLTLIEAMANHRASIATRVGGVVDLLGDPASTVAAPTGSTPLEETYIVCERGVVVRPADAEGFARGLARLIDDEALRHEMGERGRLFVERTYAKERLITDVLRLYKDMLTTSKEAASTMPAVARATAERSTVIEVPRLKGD